MRGFSLLMTLIILIGGILAAGCLGSGGDGEEQNVTITVKSLMNRTVDIFLLVSVTDEPEVVFDTSLPPYFSTQQEEPMLSSTGPYLGDLYTLMVYEVGTHDIQHKIDSLSFFFPEEGWEVWGFTLTSAGQIGESHE